MRVDATTERMNQKIRLAQKEKIPYMLVVGDREVAENTVAVRLRSGEQSTLSFADFKAKLLKTIAERTVGIELT